MSSWNYVIAGYVVGLALIWGYAALIGVALRKANRFPQSGRKSP